MHERSKLKSNKKMPLLTVFLQPWCWYASCCPGKALPAQNLISWGSDPCQEECCLPWYHGGRWPAGLLHEDTWAHSRRRCIFSLLFSSLIGYYYGNCLKDMIMMLQRFRVLRTKRITNSPWFENLLETDFFFVLYQRGTVQDCCSPGNCRPAFSDLRRRSSHAISQDCDGLCWIWHSAHLRTPLFLALTRRRAPWWQLSDHSWAFPEQFMWGNAKSC